MKLQDYTLRYLTITLLAIVPLWAAIFYFIMTEEVYDNIDDGLRNSKILIVRQAYADKNLMDTKTFGINRFTITPLPKGNYSYKEEITTSKEFMEYDNDYEPVRILTTVFDGPDGNPHRLEIRSSMVEEDELLEDLLIALSGLYLMLVISIYVLNKVILKRIWKGFYRTMQNLKNYKIGSNMTFEPSGTPIDEFRTLDTELADMLARNENIYSSQKQFIENASHELQTPLAISLNKLELFAENNSLSEEQMAEISKISDTLNRLVRLNKSLLMLSKIENRQYVEEEVVDFTQLTEQLIEDYADLAEYKKVAITTEFRAPLYFKMNKGLALTLVSNLLKNALLHNHSGGSVMITIDTPCIIISNTGDAKSLKGDAIFKRFYRDSKSEQSTGLGLSIVRSIVSNYKLSIDYSFNGAHIFTISFPEK